MYLPLPSLVSKPVPFAWTRGEIWLLWCRISILSRVAIDITIGISVLVSTTQATTAFITRSSLALCSFAAAPRFVATCTPRQLILGAVCSTSLPRLGDHRYFAGLQPPSHETFDQLGMHIAQSIPHRFISLRVFGGPGTHRPCIYAAGTNVRNSPAKDSLRLTSYFVDRLYQHRVEQSCSTTQLGRSELISLV